jgi:hypothetical protein
MKLDRANEEGLWRPHIHPATTYMATSRWNRKGLSRRHRLVGIGGFAGVLGNLEIFWEDGMEFGPEKELPAASHVPGQVTQSSVPAFQRSVSGTGTEHWRPEL